MERRPLHMLWTTVPSDEFPHLFLRDETCRSELAPSRTRGDREGDEAVAISAFASCTCHSRDRSTLVLASRTSRTGNRRCSGHPPATRPSTTHERLGILHRHR